MKKNPEIGKWHWPYCYLVKDVIEHVDPKEVQNYGGTKVFRFFLLDENDLIISKDRTTILSFPDKPAKILRKGTMTAKDGSLGFYKDLNEALTEHANSDLRFWVNFPFMIVPIQEKYGMPTNQAKTETLVSNLMVNNNYFLVQAAKEYNLQRAEMRVKTVATPNTTNYEITPEKKAEYSSIPAGKKILAATLHGMITAVKLKSGGFFVVRSKKCEATEYDNVQQLFDDQEIMGDLTY